MAKRSALEIVAKTHLTDADWVELKKLRRAYETGGNEAFSKALDELADKDLTQYLSVLSAYFPDEVADAFQDHMADQGEDDLHDLLGRLGDHSTRH
jgi:hypothetical protein